MRKQNEGRIGNKNKKRIRKVNGERMREEKRVSERERE